jgi:hypothetical protein
MANRLTNLRIDEVSSVDRGAGKGVRVLLTKRDASAEQDIWKTAPHLALLRELLRAQRAGAFDKFLHHAKTRKTDNERTKPMNALDILKRDGAVAQDVSRNIDLLMKRANMSFDQAATVLHRYQAEGGYHDEAALEKASPKRRASASNSTYDERETDRGTPMNYDAETASTEDSPWAEYTPETNSREHFNTKVALCMAETGCDKQTAIDRVGQAAQAKEKRIRKQAW